MKNKGEFRKPEVKITVENLREATISCYDNRVINQDFI